MNTVTNSIQAEAQQRENAIQLVNFIAELNTVTFRYMRLLDLKQSGRMKIQPEVDQAMKRAEDAITDLQAHLQKVFTEAQLEGIESRGEEFALFHEELIQLEPAGIRNVTSKLRWWIQNQKY